MSIQFLRNSNEDLIEGFIDERNPRAEILFLLKEPNTNDVNNDNGFWFQKCVEKNKGKYVDILGKLAKAILPQTADNADDNILKSCAYMNLYPFSGEVSASGNFNETLKMLRTLSTPVQFKNIYQEKHCFEYKEIAENRLAIIDDLICNHNCQYVITPVNIFWALYKVLGAKNTECWLKYKNKSFSYFKYKDAKILEFWHPSYRGITKELKDNFKKHQFSAR